jgi:hypothetical protein
MGPGAGGWADGSPIRSRLLSPRAAAAPLALLNPTAVLLLLLPTTGVLLSATMAAGIHRTSPRPPVSPHLFRW